LSQPFLFLLAVTSRNQPQAALSLAALCGRRAQNRIEHLRPLSALCLPFPALSMTDPSAKFQRTNAFQLLVAPSCPAIAALATAEALGEGGSAFSLLQTIPRLDGKACAGIQQYSNFFSAGRFFAKPKAWNHGFHGWHG
jgi:hypothetical protein